MTTEFAESSSPGMHRAVEKVESSLETARARRVILSLSTAGFTLLFAVWLMFGLLAIPIRTELHLSNAQFSWLTAIAILNGSIWRLSFGMLADRFGGRLVMAGLLAFCAAPAILVAYAHSYGELLTYAFLVGLAGNGFSVGIAWNSAWFPKRTQGFALGIFGAGNVGASVTKLIGPALIAVTPVAGVTLLGLHLPGGWRSIPLIYAAMLLVMSGITLLLAPAADRTPGRGRSLADRLHPLASVRVWRFGLYYVVMFGAYVALSVWLPKYYEDVYHLPLASAALLTALFIFPASLLRPVGGYLADQFGARRALYAVFTLMTMACFLLALPPLHIGLEGSARTFHFHLGVTAFTGVVFLLGMGMGIGKAAVYKYIPEYFPQDVGAVGGLVGLLGGLGGFFLPPLFGLGESLTHVPQTTFGILLVLTAASFLWLHMVVLRIVRAAAPEVRSRFEVQPTL
ncbi:MAG TPA: MFS transporter [Phycisphaerae bacterium]|jgi:NNP family nitrate/nitrite transporter-like MFS transporter|nr:MFS transporter [Phycisphaerae bacterium]